LRGDHAATKARGIHDLQALRNGQRTGHLSAKYINKKAYLIRNVEAKHMKKQKKPRKQRKTKDEKENPWRYE
jgi:hypothetical protein